MSWVKINTLHWHVVDSQSFPLQIPGFEDLSAKGAYSSKEIYTHEDVRDIVSYAGEVRHLKILLMDPTADICVFPFSEALTY